MFTKEGKKDMRESNCWEQNRGKYLTDKYFEGQ